jgi:hypothetical protein
MKLKVNVVSIHSEYLDASNVEEIRGIRCNSSCSGLERGIEGKLGC